MKKIKTSVVCGLMLAMASSAFAATPGQITAGIDGIVGHSETTIANPVVDVNKNESFRGFGINGSYAVTSDIDVSASIKSLVPKNRTLFETRVDAAKSFDFAQYGSLRVAPLGLAYAKLTLDDIGSEKYNVYYSPSISYTKDFGNKVVAEVSSIYNIAFKSHYKNDSGANTAIPLSDGYVNNIKVGYQVQKDTTVSLGYTRAMYDYAGNDYHYNTIAHFDSVALGLTHTF